MVRELIPWKNGSKASESIKKESHYGKDITLKIKKKEIFFEKNFRVFSFDFWYILEHFSISSVRLKVYIGCPFSKHSTI